MQRRGFLVLGLTAALALAGCARRLHEADPGGAGGPPATAPDPATEPSEPPAPPEPRSADASPGPKPERGHDAEHHTATGSEPVAPDELELDPGLAHTDPQEWGERVTGVRTRLDTTEPVVALSFDACGGRSGSGYDAGLIDHLRAAAVPATLFVNARWIEANPDVFDELASDPLFEIENHGTEHRPLSVAGRSAYGIRGTRSVDEVVDEVMINQRLITDLTGRSPRLFRSGTAYYDEVAVRTVEMLGLRVAGFDVLGDAGATFTAGQVEAALLRASPGSIALLHMNHPGSGTAAGVAAAVPALRARGWSFARLSEHELV